MADLDQLAISDSKFLHDRTETWMACDGFGGPEAIWCIFIIFAAVHLCETNIESLIRHSHKNAKRSADILAENLKIAASPWYKLSREPRIYHHPKTNKDSCNPFYAY